MKDIVLNVVISLVVGGGSAFAVVKYLGKSWVDNWFAKDLKKYEQQLDLLKMQKQLQYSNVYTKQAKIIEKIYKGLVRLDKIDADIRAAKFKYKKHKQEAFEEYAEIYNDCYAYASLNGIYLTDSISKNLFALLDTIAKKIIPQLEGFNEDFNEDYLKMIQKLPSLDKESMESITQSLIKEFQELLGLYKDENKSNN